MKHYPATLRHLDSSRIEINFVDKVAIFLVFIYWVIYENVIFFNIIDEYYLAAIVISLLKICIPIILLGYSGINTNLFKINRISIYTLFFLLFLFWVGLVTAISGELFEWVKLLPRFVFYLAALNLFYKNPLIAYNFFKLMIAYVVFGLLQYVSTYLSGAADNPIIIFGYTSSGISGLYANISSAMYFPGTQTPFIRYAGFWNEPSNASGSAFASFFLCRFLYRVESRHLWRYASFLCLLSGFLCLSNAGYFGFGISLLIGYVFIDAKRNARQNLLSYMIPLLFVALILFSLFGRSYLLNSEFNEIDFLRAIVGLRDSNEDVSSGRIQLVMNTLNYLNDNLIGMGLTPFDIKQNTLVSASAIFYWLLIGGPIGLILLILRELVLFKASLRLARLSGVYLCIFQAWCMVMMQHIAYGSWMNPNYFIFASAMLAFGAREIDQKVD